MKFLLEEKINKQVHICKQTSFITKSALWLPEKRQALITGGEGRKQLSKKDVL
jgi:hypothetical protein